MKLPLGFEIKEPLALHWFRLQGRTPSRFFIGLLVACIQASTIAPLPWVPLVRPWVVFHARFHLSLHDPKLRRLSARRSLGPFFIFWASQVHRGLWTAVFGRTGVLDGPRSEDGAWCAVLGCGAVILYVGFGLVDHLFGRFSGRVQHPTFESHELQLCATLMDQVVDEVRVMHLTFPNLVGRKGYSTCPRL